METYKETYAKVIWNIYGTHTYIYIGMCCPCVREGWTLDALGSYSAAVAVAAVLAAAHC